jgi:hypothetical protein
MERFVGRRTLFGSKITNCKMIFEYKIKRRYRSSATASERYNLYKDYLFLLLFSRAKKVRKRALALCIIRLPISALFRKFEKRIVPPQTVPNFF